MLRTLRNWGTQYWFLRFLFSLCLNVISATEQTLLKRGGHNICGWSNTLVGTSDITILIIAVKFKKEYLCGREIISRNHSKRHNAVKGLLSRIYITVLCVATHLYPGTTQRDTWRVLLYRINIKCVAREMLKIKSMKR